ncbi:DoxX family protein [Streptomyces sp. CC219B]|uniref:DoxX family protein n=1 Tax=Streptomyces sp. CC219B TaxID=3044574 RepID=UPI0024A856ED|nr:DoxX family protein [Streptomyces sp. CC219B]
MLIRFYVGAVFVSEGVQKFRSPDALGSGRFDRAGIPAPGFIAPPDGVLEIVCGARDFAHRSRTDLARLCGSLFLLIVGAGAHSLDARLGRTATAHVPARH